MANRGLIFTRADRERLREGVLPGGFEFHDSIGSTNDRAAELGARPELVCPFLVLAQTQTGGRGRGSNRWWSAPGAVTFSQIIEAQSTRLPPERWPQVALAAGLAACEALEHASPDLRVQVKWPNDVLIGGRKAGGILVEAPALASGRLVIGVGLNVNNRFAGAPAEIAERGTSVAEETGRVCDRVTLLLDLLERLASRIGLLANDQFALFERWRSYCLLTGKLVRLSSGSREVAGICRGIDETGRLVLATSRGAEAHASGTIISYE